MVYDNQIYKTEAQLSKKNQIVLPKKARDILGIHPHSRLLVTAYKDKIYISRKPTDWTKRMKGMGKEAWKKLGGGEVFIKKERESWGNR